MPATMAKDLSILIPSRNEMFLSRTVEDLLSNIEADTEILVGLDGDWANPPVALNERVRVVYFPESIGQRAMTNKLCKLSEARYVMKVDAHCAFDKGFDRKMIEKMSDDVTMVPVMRNLHVFDWVCANGHRRYQGKSGNCEQCGEPTTREMVWKAKTNPQSTSYCFDSEPHFQYFNDYKARPEYKKALEETGLTETMSLQGSCFMLTREKYWELNICDESFGSWGSQGIEVAVKTWCSGGRCLVNHNTWYAHLFRTQGGDFSFPYPMSGKQQESAKKTARELFLNGKWEGAKFPLYWLLRKFAPIPGWTGEQIEALRPEGFVEPEKAPTKGILFYTDNKLNLKIARKVQKQLLSIGLPITSVSLKPMSFGNNIHLPLKRGYLTMAKQILRGLESMTEDIIFFCEHDVLYHPSHFDFAPEKEDVFYYNTNVWRVRLSDGHGIRTNDCRQLSGLCAYKSTLLRHYRKRVALLEAYWEELELQYPSHEGREQVFNRYVRAMGFEPGTHNRAERVDNLPSDRWESKVCNIDIRHDTNSTPSRWDPSQFRNAKFTEGWQEAIYIPGWGKLEDNL